MSQIKIHSTVRSLLLGLSILAILCSTFAFVPSAQAANGDLAGKKICRFVRWHWVCIEIKPWFPPQWPPQKPALPQPAPAPTIYARTIRALEDIAMRSGPGVEFDNIEDISDGDELLALGSAPVNGWWRVLCLDNLVGDCYVSANPSKTKVLKAVDVLPYFVKALDTINVREGPSVEEESVGELDKGEMLVVFKKSANGKWWKVNCLEDTFDACFVSADEAKTRLVPME